ncbi:MAG: hypothetical protein M1396_01820, partial [Chloroflexi bacterium]|nr:hypothetical protein [Chloroflexota bacterium]
DFFRGFRLFFWRSWQLGAVDLVIGGLLAVNIWFYGTRGSSFLKLFDILWLYALVFWFLMQPFLFGLLVFQQDRRLRNTVRNAFLVVLDNIWTSLSMLIVGLVFMLLSVALGLPILAFSGIAGAVWSTRVLDEILAKYPNTRRRSQEEDEAQGDATGDLGRANALPISAEAQRRSILARQRSHRR